MIFYEASPTRTAKSDDLFRSRLDSIINPRHELVVLANKIDWDYLDGPGWNRSLPWKAAQPFLP